MRLRVFGLLLSAVSIPVVAAYLRGPVGDVHAATQKQLSYGKDGSYVVPRNYREWVFLSSGIDMVYGPKATSPAGPSMFDNVFVDPEAYRSFLGSGTWPDKTVMIVEIRGAETNASINHGGHSQGAEVTGIEVHLKDSARFAGGWAFFDVNGDGVGKLIPQPADCYTCHREHAAVDTTFVQFYPTLLRVAKEKKTLSAAYLKEFGSAGRGQ